MLIYLNSIINACVLMSYALEHYLNIMIVLVDKGTAIRNNIANIKITHNAIMIINITQQSSVSARKYFSTNKTYRLNILMPIFDLLKILHKVFLKSIIINDLLLAVL